ncbi:MAG TPA: hypothetical protein H9767_03020 [Candidatus Nosocomiicoccus stercorigallinarum]|nr:hypothetical protein [Candidatus Nosocomiicoccus stercorigallinarum]
MEEKIGYLTATNITRQLLGEMSYRVKMFNTEVSIIEQKKKRISVIGIYILTEENKRKIGKLILNSNTTQILKYVETHYVFMHENSRYKIKKPYMQSKKSFSMIDDNKKEIARHEEMDYLSTKRKIKILNSDGDSFDASIILVMSVIKYIS